MNSQFIHLHIHTQYSILDGAASIESLMSKSKEYGMNAVAITDHGNMYGVLHFVNEAKKAGIKPIIGCELYVAKESRFLKRGKQDRSGYHLILLAKNITGYHNLAKLSSLGYIEGFYYTPRIDKELLRKYSEGLIALTACIGGEIPEAILNNDMNKAENALKEYLEIFGEDFYLEMDRYGLHDQETVNKALLILSEKYNVKLVAANDVHFINAEDAEAHNILICLNTGNDIESDKDMKYTGQEFFKSTDEMKKLFADIPEAITNTQEIVDKVEDYELKHDIIIPVFPLPEGFTDDDEYLHYLTFEGAKKRYPDLDEKITERLEFELSVLKEKKFASYFLIVQDFINEARNLGVSVGPGRGSAAGSAVAYCIGITNIDPIKYNLLFERFLNPERVSMPDIDIDFDDYGRDKIIEYVVNKYGKERVAQIVTFGTMAAKSAIRDVARVLKLPLQEADKLAKLVPDGPNVYLRKAYKDVKELADAKENGQPLVRKTLTFAETLEGSTRNVGTHACGVIIGPDNLIEYLPLSTSKDSDLVVTQYEGKLVETVGMLKMDFLGLKTLTIIKDALDNIEKRHRIKINIDNIPVDDQKTFELYQKGETIGTFQFESDGMRTHLKELKPNNIEDLIAMNALYRPGPMDFIPQFINRKKGREKVEYPHQMLEQILKPTYGIMVYQEQIMQAAQIMGGFTPGAADGLRKAMGKKIMEIMEKQKLVFIEGAQKKGVDKDKAAKVYETMQKFGEYGFNRSHSAAYSVIAYQTGYLKAHYPAEYMAAVLTNNLNDIKKITFFIEECKRQNISVLGPDINESIHNFFVNNKGEIRFGLGAIKGVGETAVIAVIEERDKNGHFNNIFDFVKRVNLSSINKKCLESLAFAGAFDSFKGHRAQYFFRENPSDITFIEKLIKYAGNYKNNLNSMQVNIFGEAKEEESLNIEIPQCESWSRYETLKNEKEVAGFYVTGHPLDDYKTEIDNFCNYNINTINQNLNNLKNHEIKFAGLVTSATQNKIAKNGNPFGFFTIEDYTDSIRIVLFAEDYLKMKHFIEEGRFLYIRAKVQEKWGNEKLLELKIISITLLSEVIEKFTNNISVQLPINEIDVISVKKIKEFIQNNTGKCNLKFTVFDALENTNITLNANKYKVDSKVFIKLLEQENLKYKLN